MSTHSRSLASRGHQAHDQENQMAETSFVLGLVGLVSLIVPPGLVVAPICGGLAIAMGAVGRARGDEAGRGGDRAFLGIVFGVVSVAASLVLLYVFRHLIGRVLHDINFG